MTEHEGRDLASLDLYVQSQLAKAAATYAAHADLDGRLIEVLLTGKQHENGDPDSNP
jgi:hypothetical protein